MDNNWINLHIISIRSSSLFLFSPSGWLGRGRKAVNELIWLISKSTCYFINEKSSSAAILWIIIFGMRRIQQLAKSQKLRMIVLLKLPYLFVDRIQLCPPNTALIPFECLNWKEQLWGGKRGITETKSRQWKTVLNILQYKNDFYPRKTNK